MEIGRLELPGNVIWYDAAAFGRFEPGLFDPGWLREKGCLAGESSGRNVAHFVRFEGREMVLRHYCRGGLVGRVVKDLYLREPVQRSRAMREFTLLGWMAEKGLPVPRPLAARFSLAGLWYRADILVERIPDARTLADVLADSPLPEDVWRRIGGVIADMHRLGVHHSDLNCRNILLDGRRRVWLIDFDKCERRRPGGWAQANLDRLKRSLTKEKGKVPALNWTDADWAALVAGYRERFVSKNGGDFSL